MQIATTFFSRTTLILVCHSLRWKSHQFTILRNRIMCSTMMNLFYINKQKVGGLLPSSTPHTHIWRAACPTQVRMSTKTLFNSRHKTCLLWLWLRIDLIFLATLPILPIKMRIRFQMSSFLQNIEVNCTNFNNIFAAFLSWAGWSHSSLPFLTPCSGIFES